MGRPGRERYCSKSYHLRQTNTIVVIIGSHADNATDVQQAASFKKVRNAIQLDNTIEYIWMMDANNVTNPRLP